MDADRSHSSTTIFPYSDKTISSLIISPKKHLQGWVTNVTKYAPSAK